MLTRARRPLGALFVILVLVAGGLPGASFAAELNLPGFRFDLDDNEAPQQVSSVMQIVFLLTVLSIVPGLLVLTTSFTRLAVVLSFLRHALGVQQAPPNQVIIGLALFLTVFIMQPVWQRIYDEAFMHVLDM